MRTNNNTRFLATAAIFVIGIGVLSRDIGARLNLDPPFMKRSNAMTTDEANVELVSDLVKMRRGEKMTRSGGRCLTFRETFDNLVASSNSVFITMPAKAAGTSMNAFTRACVGDYPGKGNPIKSEGPKKENLFLESLALPKITSSHLFSDEQMVSLIQNIPRQSLLLYIHRDEGDRVVSAIRHVLQTGVCTSKATMFEDKMTITMDGSRCILNEKDVIDYVIKERVREIGMGASDIMTCGSFDAIEDNFPTMVFAHYKRADEIQEVLAKYYCPDLLDHPSHNNVAMDKVVEVFLKLEKDGQEVAVDDWLEAKRHLLEYMFEMKSKEREGKTCQSKMRSMEDDLFVCEDELLQITRDTSF